MRALFFLSANLQSLTSVFSSNVVVCYILLFLINQIQNTQLPISLITNVCAFSILIRQLVIYRIVSLCDLVSLVIIYVIWIAIESQLEWENGGKDFLFFYLSLYLCLFLSEALIIILYHMLDPVHQVNLQFQEVETLGFLLQCASPRSLVLKIIQGSWVFFVFRDDLVPYI